jgi:polyisoprenoid-binding protein YceI
MTNSNNKLILIVPLVLILGAVVLLMTVKKTPDQPITEQNDPAVVTQTPPTEEPTDPAATSTPNFAMYVTGEVPATAKKYMITKGMASYTVNKVFVGKPVAVVTGVTELVEGAGWYDEQSKKFYVKANIDLKGLKSDSEKRDSDILPFFEPPVAVFEINGDNASDTITLSEPFETDLVGNLTVGNTTKELTFAVTGTLTEETFAAQGSTKVNMSDLGIKTPSLLNVYTVEDMTELKFEIEGARLTEVQE